MNNSPSPARSTAVLILSITAIASGIAAVLSLTGRNNISLQICGGAIVLNILILLFGAFVVGSSNVTPEDQE